MTKYTEAELRAYVERVVDQLRTILPKDVLFALFLTDHGPTGSLAYAANMVRADAARCARDWADRLENVT